MVAYFFSDGWYTCTRLIYTSNTEKTERHNVIWYSSVILTWQTGFTLEQLIYINIYTTDYIYSLFFSFLFNVSTTSKKSVLLIECSTCLTDSFKRVFKHSHTVLFFLKKSLEETNACNFYKMVFLCRRSIWVAKLPIKQQSSLLITMRR